MKAVIRARYGPPDLLAIRDVPRPVPTSDQVLIRVHATTVSRTDCGLLRAHPFFLRFMTGLFRPKQTILGMDFAGTVESIGAQVTAFIPGDHVFGMSPERYGAHAEYICMPEAGEIAEMPEALAFGQAVVCEGAWYAHATLGHVTPGQDVLIYGASGAIGTAAVQLAKAYGARVTAVVATRHVVLATSLGADVVIDFTTQDFAEIGTTFDIVFDAVGKTSYVRCRRLLKPTGIFSATDLGPWWSTALLAAWFAITGRQRVAIPFPNHGRALVESVKDLMERGTFRGVFDRTYRCDEIVEAYDYVESGQKTGIVVIDMQARGA